MFTSAVVTRITYAILVVLNLMISALLLETGRGNVPFPQGLQWAVPVLVAGLTGVTLFLPRFGGERMAARVDALKKRGVPKARMRVVDIDNPHMVA